MPSETAGLSHRNRLGSAVTPAYHKLLRSCHLHQVHLFCQSRPSDWASTKLRFLAALVKHSDTVRIKGSCNLLTTKPAEPFQRGCPARLSHTLRRLLTESQTIVHLTFPSALPQSLYRSNKHRYSRDRRSRYSTSRVNHLRPHEPPASTCSWLEWMSIR